MRTKDERKRKAIRDAAVAEVVAGGRSGASISKIAARAKVSEGTIYLYFKGKSALLEQAFLEIKREMHERLMTAARRGENSAEAIEGMWHALFDHVAERPNDVAFAEYASAAQILDEDKHPEIVAMAGEVENILVTAMDDGTLRRLPVETVITVLAAPALQHARTVVINHKALDPLVLEMTFDAIWRGISAS